MSPQFSIGDIVVISKDQKELVRAFDFNERDEAYEPMVPKWSKDMDGFVDEVFVVRGVMRDWSSEHLENVVYRCGLVAVSNNFTYDPISIEILEEYWDMKAGWIELAPEHVANAARITSVI